MSDLVETALRIAEKAHKGQVRKWTGEPYIEHLKRVAARFKNPETKAAALLHDVLEDTDWTPDKLINAGMPLRVVSMVAQLTRRDESYRDYICRIRDSVSIPNNSVACGVITIKLADIQDNLRDNHSESMIKRYEWAYKCLRREIE